MLIQPHEYRSIIQQIHCLKMHCSVEIQGLFCNNRKSFLKAMGSTERGTQTLELVYNPRCVSGCPYSRQFGEFRYLDWPDLCAAYVSCQIHDSRSLWKPCVTQIQIPNFNSLQNVYKNVVTICSSPRVIPQQINFSLEKWLSVAAEAYHLGFMLISLHNKNNRKASFGIHIMYP